jgi:fatty acid desaturase
MALQIQDTYNAISLREGAKAYSELRHKITEAGLLKHQYFYYFLHVSGVTVGFFISLYAIWATQNLWLTFVWSLVFAFFSIQYGGIVHDAGHRAMFKSVFWNDFFGQIAGGLIAMGYSE